MPFILCSGCLVSCLGVLEGLVIWCQDSFCDSFNSFDSFPQSREEMRPCGAGSNYWLWGSHSGPKVASTWLLFRFFSSAGAARNRDAPYSSFLRHKRWRQSIRLLQQSGSMGSFPANSGTYSDGVIPGIRPSCGNSRKALNSKVTATCTWKGVKTLQICRMNIKVIKKLRKT